MLTLCAILAADVVLTGLLLAVIVLLLPQQPHSKGLTR
jgi:hypothetical protein